MVKSYNQLENLTDNSTALEKSNVLMKLKETLTSEDESGVIHARYPEGISVYHCNVAYALWGWLSFIAAFTLWVSTPIGIH